MNGSGDKASYLDSDLPLVLSCDTDSFRMLARKLKPSQGLITSKWRCPFESRSVDFNLCGFLKMSWLDYYFAF